MLTPDEARRILEEHGGGAEWKRHCLAVAGAVSRAGTIVGRRRRFDLDRAESLALVHDIGRCVTHDPVRHGVEGYRLLSRLGHEDEARFCVSHILFGLAAAEAARFGLPRKDFVLLTEEERLVALVDYLVEGDRPTTLAARFASLRARNGGHGFFGRRLNRAWVAASSFLLELEREVGESIERIVAGR